MGSLLVTDLMPVASEDEKQHMLQPEHEILRLVVYTVPATGLER